MRAYYAIILTALTGCASASPPAPAAAGTGEAVAPTEPATAEPAATDAPTAEPAAPEPPAAEPLDLTRGKRVEAHGLRIMLRSTATDHRATGPTLLRAELEVRKGDEESKIKLERADGGELEFEDAFGVKIALESLDAAAKPSTARILVRP